MGGGQLSKRLILRVSLVLSAVFGFSLFVVTPAYAADCVGPVSVNVSKRVSPSRNIAPADPINHTITVSVTTTGATITPPCDVTIDLRDFLGPNLTFTGSASGATCAGTNPVQCSVKFTGVDSAGQSKNVIIRTTAGAPGATGQYCDHANANAEPPAVGGDLTEIVCATAEEEPAPPDNGGGGGFGDFDDDFGGFGDGGFGGFGGGFDTTTPLGGVDTGAGGTARSNSAVPQIALGSLLAIGLLLLALRRFRRA